MFTFVTDSYRQQAVTVWSDVTTVTFAAAAAVAAAAAALTVEELSLIHI